MRLALSLAVLAGASGLLLSPHRFISRAPAVRMDECASTSDRIAKLDAALERLQVDGFAEEILAPLKKELAELKLDNVRQELADLKVELSSPAEAPLPAPPAAPPSTTVTSIIGLCESIDAMAMALASGDSTPEALASLRSAREERAASLLALFERDPSQYAEILPTLLPRIPEFDFPTVDGVKLNSPAAVEQLTGGKVPPAPASAAEKGGSAASRGTPAAAAAAPADSSGAPDAELAAAFSRIRRRREAEAAPPVPAPSVLDEPPPPPDDDVPPPPPLDGAPPPPGDDGHPPQHPTLTLPLPLPLPLPLTYPLPTPYLPLVLTLA
jgi:hypothetical protein